MDVNKQRRDAYAALAAYERMRDNPNHADPPLAVASQLAKALRAYVPPVKFGVFERVTQEPPQALVQHALFDSEAEAQDYIAREDPAARRTLLIVEVRNQGRQRR